MTQHPHGRSYQGSKLDHIAMPMGGLGAGMLCLTGVGGFAYQSWRHAPNMGPMRPMFASLCVTRVGRKNDENIARVLEGPIAESIKRAFAWNPAYPLLQAHRIVLGAKPFEYKKEVDGVLMDQVSGLGPLGDHLLRSSLWALLFLCLGYAVFMSRRHKYADLV